MEGHWVPGNVSGKKWDKYGSRYLTRYERQTTVCVPHKPAFTSNFNFKDPKQFVPERWLGDPAYASDSKAVLLPFSAGSRDCIGKK